VSGELDALAAYVGSLTAAPASARRAGGSFSALAEEGRVDYAQHQCSSCHVGPQFTDSALDVRHDVGTIHPDSGERLGAPLDGFDTPTLLGAWFTAPYLHDGSAPTLEQAIAAHSGIATTAAERTAIAAFVAELSPGDVQPPPVHSAVSHDLYDTGLNANFAKLAASADDPHYQVIDAPLGSTVDRVECASAQWVDCAHTEPDSQWLAIGTAAGRHTVRTSFTIPADAVQSSIALSGRWSSHEATVDILINGVSTGRTSPTDGAGTWHALSIATDGLPGPFVHGVNTLDFVIDKSGVTGGLRTDDLVVQYLPEPALWSALGSAIVLLAWLAPSRRARNSGSALLKNGAPTVGRGRRTDGDPAVRRERSVQRARTRSCRVE
jgi:hypothetical protein